MFLCFYVRTYFLQFEYLASFPPSSLQDEEISKSCEDEMRQPIGLLYKDTSFPVLKYIETTGGHMQEYPFSAHRVVVHARHIS